MTDSAAERIRVTGNPTGAQTKLRVLSLFAGIGGFELGLERTGGFVTVAQCEIDPFCRRVLAKHWPHVKRYEDVRELTAAQLEADGIAVDVICGGFPCQDLSTAGKQTGIDGERSGLWSELCRLIGELRPRFAIVENVPNLISGERGAWFGRVLGDLAALGYDALWHCIPASALGAPHIRDRVWLVASADAAEDGFRAISTVLAQHTHARGNGCTDWRAPMPAVSRMGDGLPGELDRLGALGNAVVPAIPELIGNAILAAQACQGQRGAFTDAPKSRASETGALTLTQENKVLLDPSHASNFGGETVCATAPEIGA